MKVVELKSKLPADKVLDNAKGHYESVMIVGWNKEDELEVFSSDNMTKAADIVYLLELVKNKILTGEYS